MRDNQFQNFTEFTVYYLPSASAIPSTRVQGVRNVMLSRKLINVIEFSVNCVI